MRLVLKPIFVISFTVYVKQTRGLVLHEKLVLHKKLLLHERPVLRKRKLVSRERKLVSRERQLVLHKRDLVLHNQIPVNALSASRIPRTVSNCPMIISGTNNVRLCNPNLTPSENSSAGVLIWRTAALLSRMTRS